VQLTNRFRDAFSVNIALDNIFNYAPKHYLYNSPTTLGINLMVGVSIDIDRF
jgi:outer membrane receptor for ferrienterochelin and colicins